uniref:Uncharacterized protein n=1 Tax=Chromera velia CCMP2878 TaxID=1169474 RepID=A0A0G4I0B9_9ALVE|eukprot:Cvel_9882.t1-p1 / transcript=Cvel_9882.t1 / gene=Cvel_9882 / organism=Chromera_velia_CCMP2878 / gene_product=hypothetical protein / transcript_product=hypothetical protein / location=Cvel_scaffold583:9937-10920(+) / protein_length=328 / sequence_SO=supercontig / SO=protein_coding / is_pseudo=false
MVAGHARSGAVKDKIFTTKIDSTSETAAKYPVTGTDVEKETKRIVKFWAELGEAKLDNAEKRTPVAESFIQTFPEKVKTMKKKKEVKTVADVISLFKRKWQEHGSTKGTVSANIASRRFRKALPRAVRSSLAVSLSPADLKDVTKVLNAVKSYTAEAGLLSDDSDLALSSGSSDSEGKGDRKKRKGGRRGMGRNDFILYQARGASTLTGPDAPRFTRVFPRATLEQPCPLCAETSHNPKCLAVEHKCSDYKGFYHLEKACPLNRLPVFKGTGGQGGGSSSRSQESGRRAKTENHYTRGAKMINMEYVAHRCILNRRLVENEDMSEEAE